VGATPDVWERGASYEPYIGRWSRLVAKVFVNWLQLPARGRWVEVGCGTGALTETILTLARPASVHAVDASEGYVAFARRTIADDRVRFEVADARRLPCEDSTSDAAVSGLVLNFVPEPERMAVEMAVPGRCAVRSEAGSRFSC
jgi:ubiquinone/menaquinone biosynthesis C-methylase UbiE